MWCTCHISTNTIGRGKRTLVNDPIASEESQWPGIIYLTCGSLANWTRVRNRNPSEIPKHDRHPFLQFRYGNIWHNWISNYIQVVAFAPIDDKNTLMYMQFFNTVRVPVLRQITGWIGSLGNLVIERHPRRVVITQRLHRPVLDCGEILIPGDNLIVLYRIIR
jgi:phenylpropionate dioxygenase-like ring-hydroxylating dioxygenase large terminal subunit